MNPKVSRIVRIFGKYTIQKKYNKSIITTNWQFVLQTFGLITTGNIEIAPFGFFDIWFCLLLFYAFFNLIVPTQF